MLESREQFCTLGATLVGVIVAALVMMYVMLRNPGAMNAGSHWSLVTGDLLDMRSC